MTSLALHVESPFLNFHEYFCFSGWAASLRSRPSADKNIKITIPLFSLLNHFGFPAETGFEMKFVVPNEFFFCATNTSAWLSLSFIPALEITEVFLDSLKRNLCAM